MEFPPVLIKFQKMLESNQTHFLLSRDDLYWAIEHYKTSEEIINELKDELDEINYEFRVGED